MIEHIKSIVNLTPDTIVLVDPQGVVHEYLPSGTIARIDLVVSTPAHMVLGCPVPVGSQVIYGRIQGIPKPIPHTVFIVSELVGLGVAKQEPDRGDVFVLDQPRKDEAGRLVADKLNRTTRCLGTVGYSGF